jgi:hypothetical protein
MLTYGQFDAEVQAVAQHLIDLGLAPGERILILTGARTACIVTAIAALSLGIEPLLVPIGLDGAQLASIAASTGSAAIAGPSSYAGINLEETLFDAAARVETIRFVASLGPAEMDGAIDLAPERLGVAGARLPPPSEIRPRIGTLNLQAEAIFHDQSVLLAAALDFVGKAEIAAGSHLLSTLAPASFGSLVTGPVASLLSGAPITLFGPFDAASFLAILDATGPNHCVLPAAILADFAKAGLLADGVLASAIVVMRHETALPTGCDCPLSFVHASDENSALTVERRTRANSQAASILSGEVLAPVLPARQPERSWR